MPNVKEILTDWLMNNHYDGLIGPGGWCQCNLDKLMKYDYCEDCYECRPAIEGEKGLLTEAKEE